MTDFLREVDDAMRTERMTRLWNEHKTAIIVGCVALILGTAASTIYNSWTADKKRETTTTVITALEDSNPLQALTKAAEADRSNYKSLVAMTAASKAMETKQYSEALKLYKDVSADRSAPALFRDLATIQKVNLTLDQATDIPAEDLLAEISKVANDKNSAWIGQALFTRAIVKAHKAKDIKGAIGDLELVIGKTDLPSTLRARAQALLDTYQLQDQS
jgi:hypothetical protein